MLNEEILRNSYSVLSIPVAILKLSARNHLLKILNLNYGNGIPAVIARTGYDSNSQTKTMAVVVKQSDVAIHIQDVVVLQNLREMEFWPLLPKQIKITIPDQNHGRCCKIYKHCNSYSSMEFIALPSTSKDSSMENSTGSSSIATLLRFASNVKGCIS